MADIFKMDEYYQSYAFKSFKALSCDEAFNCFPYFYLDLVTNL